MMTSCSQRGQPGIWRSNRPHSWSNKMLEKTKIIIISKFLKLTWRLSWRRGCPTGGWRGRTGSRTGATAGAGRPGLHPYHDLQTSNMLYFMYELSFNPVCLLSNQIKSNIYFPFHLITTNGRNSHNTRLIAQIYK
jgi:hypothetical protein